MGRRIETPRQTGFSLTRGVASASLRHKMHSALGVASFWALVSLLLFGFVQDQARTRSVTDLERAVSRDLSRITRP